MLQVHMYHELVSICTYYSRTPDMGLQLRGNGSGTHASKVRAAHTALTLAQGEVALVLSAAKGERHGGGALQRRRGDIDRDGRIGAEEIEEGALRRPSGEPLHRDGIKLQLQRVGLSARGRLGGADVVRLLIDDDAVKPQIDLPAQHDILEDEQEIKLALNPGRPREPPAEIARLEAGSQGQRFRARAFAGGAGKQRVNLAAELGGVGAVALGLVLVARRPGARPGTAGSTRCRRDRRCAVSPAPGWGQAWPATWPASGR